MVKIEIDQSGKWESHTCTALGVDINGVAFSSRIEHSEKNLVLRSLGSFDQLKNCSKKQRTIRLFSYTLFLTIRHILREEDLVVIDKEYAEQDQQIRDILLYLFSKFNGLKINPKNIQFGQVGKDCIAHRVALQTFKGLRQPERNLKMQDYFALLDKTAQIRLKALERRKRHLKS